LTGVAGLELHKPAAMPGTFVDIVMYAEQDPAKLPSDWNVRTNVGLHSFAGMCDVQLTKLSDDPHEAEYSTSDCDMLSVFEDAAARIESARFRVKNCP
jgi:hypothetical protein